MKRRGKVIYFGEELEDCNVEVHDDTILVDGRPLIPMYSTLDFEEESEFVLDDKTQKAVEESLELLDPQLLFEDNAERVASYLKKRGFTVRKEDFYGDVLLETDEGWGVAVLFNEEARIKMSKPQEEAPEELADTLKELCADGLVIVDEGILTMIPAEEAEEILEALEGIYSSKEDFPTKIKKIQDLIGIPEKSARKLLMQHT